jgi:2-methylcitrate dehydratase PrpD
MPSLYAPSVGQQADGVTRRLATAITQASPSRDASAIAAARRGILDFLAAAFAGASDSGYQKLLTVSANDSHGEASVIGSSARASAQQAALLNGYAGHALDYDDVHSSVRGQRARLARRLRRRR